MGDIVTTSVKGTKSSSSGLIQSQYRNFIIMFIFIEIYANVRVKLGNNTGSDKGKRRRKYRLGERRKLVLRTKTGKFPLEKSDCENV